MCGLAGVARFGADRPDPGASALLRRMARAVAHRGPDDEEYYESGPIGLGFTRLSLVDPEGGAQPLRLEDDSLVLIANGEIYNHRELAASLPAGTRMRTRSDCEVLLHLYRRDGLDFLSSVRGMFSLVLWDRDRGRVVFARDRFGVKPLFFHRNADRIVFASEIKALFQDPACPRELDWPAALGDQMMAMPPAFETGPAQSWFKDIVLVPAATILTVDLGDGAVSEHKYWDFPRFDGGRDASAQEFVSDYGRLLASAVEDCGMADVEIGLFLSGGVDSAAVAALSGVKPRTFTALNGSTLLNGDAEAGHRSARALGLANDQVLLDTRQVPSAQEWRDHVWLLETPMAGPESYYKFEMYRYVRAHAPGIKAMLLGGGADEFNGGYTGALSGGGDWTSLLANLTRLEAGRELYRQPRLGGWWNDTDLPMVSRRALRGRDEPGADPYEAMFRWKYRDVQQYNCWHEDRTAAGNGIEARVPFLDHRLVELVAGIPEHLRAELLWDKQILRRAMSDVLPPQFAQREKIAFFYGDGVDHTRRTFIRMLAQDDGTLVEEALSGPAARHYLDADNVRAQFARLAADPRSDRVELLLRVLNLGLLEQLAANPPAPPVEAVRPAVALSVPVEDWDAKAPEIEQIVLHRVAPTDELVLAPSPDMLLLHTQAEPTIWYLTVSGSIEYVLDETDNPSWVRLLLALDGTRTLKQHYAEHAIDPEAVRELIVQTLDLGLITEVEVKS